VGWVGCGASQLILVLDGLGMEAEGAMSGDLRTGRWLVFALLGVGGCGKSDPNQFCHDGQLSPREWKVTLAAGESRLVDQLGPAMVVGSDKRDYQTVVIETYCDSGECSAAFVAVDSTRIGVPGRAEVTLGYQYDQAKLVASHGGSGDVVVRVVLSGSFHTCYL
jgi:hypothetical protein